VFVRSFAGGLATKFDPVQWHIRESNENVAKSCATVTLMGVPVFGVDFTLLPESHIRIVKAWVDFYRRHQTDLSKGRFMPVGFGGLFPQFQILRGAKVFIYVGSSSTTPTSINGCREVYIVNASDTNRVALALDEIRGGRWLVVVRDCFLAESGIREIMAPGEKLVLDEVIPQGGLLELRRV